MADLSFGNKYAKVTEAGALKVDGSEIVQPVSGAFWPAVQAVSGIFWPSIQPVSGAVNVLNWPVPAFTAVVARVAVGIVVMTLLAANPNRKRAIIFNETGTLRVKLGPNASLTDYTYEILASAGNNRQDIDGYSGIITAVKVSGASFAQVTEL